MNSMQANTQQIIPGFWKRLLLAAEEIGESYPERIEKRISRVEAEVERLSANQKKLEKV